jgi:serine/threonine-protein kinase
MRVLIADDDPLIARLLEANLKRWGYDVSVVRDGLAAYDALVADEGLRFVISDWMMPGIDGVELCRRLREMPDRPYTYFMLLTSKDQAEDLIHAFQAGADEFINKPFRARELQMRIEAAKRLLVQLSTRGVAVRQPPQLDRGTLVGGRYRLTRLLGAGGMGTVWEAEHVSLGTVVAIKFLRPEPADNDAARARFETEARAAARIVSPYAPRVFDFGEFDGGQPFMVMDRLSGVSLADAVVARGPLRPAEVARVVREAASVLARAHALGIVHRDVKPDNILMVEDDLLPGVRTTKLIDFGVAKVEGDASSLTVPVTSSTGTSRMLITQEGVVVGTPHFMSPEYLGGVSKPNAALDAWGLAVSMFVALVGRLPFDGDTLWAVMRAVREDPLPVPSEINAAVPAGFDAWWARACCREPTLRFANITEQAEALAEVCGAAPVQNAGDAFAGANGSLPRIENVPTYDQIFIGAPSSGAASVETPLDTAVPRPMGAKPV